MNRILVLATTFVLLNPSFCYAGTMREFRGSATGFFKFLGVITIAYLAFGFLCDLERRIVDRKRAKEREMIFNNYESKD